jgi:hypothetical protein
MSTENESPDDGEWDGLEELNELLTVSTRAATTDDLDALLQESVALREEEQATRKLREDLKKGRMSKAEKEETERKIREWEARRVWNTLANVLVWDRIVCDCGHEVLVFSHLMHMQEHREIAANRTVIAEETVPGLPNLIAKQTIEVPVCECCAAGKGFDLKREDMAWVA